MFSYQFCDKHLHFGELPGRRKDHALLGQEVKLDLLLENLLDFSFKGTNIRITRLHGAVYADAECQRVLMLVGERDEVLVTEHKSIIA